MNLKGVDPEGSQRAWDLWVKSRFIDAMNRGRALIQASGTPITNTLGEMFTLLRFQNEEALRERGVHEFDAWASTFGDTEIFIELQPSGTYKPVERFSRFVNVPELIDMFRARADVVMKDDLRKFLRLPRIRDGQRQLITAEASDAFRAYQEILAERITEIENRTRRVQKGDDILLKVITDGRHAAIDMRLVWPGNDNEPHNKLNKLIANVYSIWVGTAEDRFRNQDGSQVPIPGGGRIIFSDLGTLAAEQTRGFSAYRWIKSELIRLGVPAREIAIIQDDKRTADKQRLFRLREPSQSCLPIRRRDGPPGFRPLCRRRRRRLRLRPHHRGRLEALRGPTAHPHHRAEIDRRDDGRPLRLTDPGGGRRVPASHRRDRCRQDLPSQAPPPGGNARLLPVHSTAGQGRAGSTSLRSAPRRD